MDTGIPEEEEKGSKKLIKSNVDNSDNKSTKLGGEMNAKIHEAQ